MMLPMEPVEAAGLIRALSWQFSRVFITLDSQHGTSPSDINGAALRLALRGSEELSSRARLPCSGARCSWVCRAGAAAQKVESRVRHFAP